MHGCVAHSKPEHYIQTGADLTPRIQDLDHCCGDVNLDLTEGPNGLVQTLGSRPLEKIQV